nr:hypothetical protein GCM10017745_40250 [Saccharothrix mutabilis subsp. capreolus]
MIESPRGITRVPPLDSAWAGVGAVGSSAAATRVAAKADNRLNRARIGFSLIVEVEMLALTVDWRRRSGVKRSTT